MPSFNLFFNELQSNYNYQEVSNSFGSMLEFIIHNFILPIKVFFLLYIFILTRASLPRYRYDQLMQIGWKMILPYSLVFTTFYSFYLIIIC